MLKFKGICINLMLGPLITVDYRRVLILFSDHLVAFLQQTSPYE